MVLMPGCLCCGATTDGCFTDVDRMVVTISGLPHENKSYNLSGATYTEFEDLGFTYLDDYDGSYVLYKAKTTEPTSTDYSGSCWFTTFDAYENGTSSPVFFSLTISYTYDYNGPSSSLRWRRSVSMSVLGGEIEWSDSGSGSAPSPSKTYTNSDVTVNESPELYYYYAYYLPYPWTLTGTTCSIAEYDAATHASAATPCECFDPPSTVVASGTLYKPTCLTYNGTSDPGDNNYINHYYPYPWGSPQDSLWCSTYNSTSTAGVVTWRDYGTDELDLTISDLTRTGDTIAIAGTYTLEFSGNQASGTYARCRDKPIGPSWATGFTHTHNSLTYEFLLTVVLQRLQNSHNNTLILPSTRRLYVGVNWWASDGSLGGTFYQSDGTQGEDGHTPGNMPSVSGGVSSGDTQYLTPCTFTYPGVSHQWDYTVDQA